MVFLLNCCSESSGKSTFIFVPSWRIMLYWEDVRLSKTCCLRRLQSRIRQYSDRIRILQRHVENNFKSEEPAQAYSVLEENLEDLQNSIRYWRRQISVNCTNWRWYQCVKKAIFMSIPSPYYVIPWEKRNHPIFWAFLFLQP